MKIPESFRNQFLPDLSLLLVTLIWGLSFTILKNILGDEVSPILFVLGRFLVATIVVFPFCRTNLMGLDRRGLAGGVLLGALLFAGFSLQSIGIEFTTASKSAFLTGLSAVFVPVFLIVHRGKLPPIINGLAILVAIAGMYLLTGPAGGEFNRGDFLTLLCAVAFGAQIYVMGLVSPGRDFLSLTFVELSTTTLLAAIFLPLETVKFQLTSGSVIAIIFMGIFATAGALLIQTWAQRRTSAVKTGLILTAEPVFAYMFATTLLGDYFNPVQKLGGAIIISAVIAAEVLPLLIARKKPQRY
jgi:drug/metabolite transporter (DMT)-like permease